MVAYATKGVSSPFCTRVGRGAVGLCGASEVYVMDKPDIETVLNTLCVLYKDQALDQQRKNAASKWLTQLQSSVCYNYYNNIIIIINSKVEYTPIIVR